MFDAKAVHAALQGLAKASRDNTDIEIVLYGVGQSVAILGVVFADEVAICQRHDTTIGHNTVHIENYSLNIG
jgi:hypothetical protein